MKKISILLLAMVFTATLLAGCRGSGATTATTTPTGTSEPMTKPTTEPTTMPTTQPSTEPTTMPTEEDMTDGASGIMDDLIPSEGTDNGSGTRRMLPRRR